MNTSIKPFRFSGISEDLPVQLQPVVDQNRTDEYHLTLDQQKWRRDGVLHLPNFIPETLLYNYEECWRENNSGRPRGWPYCTPYMNHEEIKDLGLFPPLMEKMKEIIGSDMGMHLNLTGWISTERKWHQDSYLNPTFVGNYYIAVWIALEDIHPDSGPFQYVRGSHRWPSIRQEKLFQFLPNEWATNPNWPTLSQDAVAKALEEEISKRGVDVTTYLPKRGDCLLWHANLVHQGSKPNDPKMQRKSFIAHYSALSHRHDMPNRDQHLGSHYFVLHEKVPV